MLVLRILLLFCCVISLACADCLPDTSPDPSFERSLRLANKGNIIEQRNVAVSYEAGYLVGRCYKSAYYWYKQAAKQGDMVSAQWLARSEKLKKIINGPECYGTICTSKYTRSATTGIAHTGSNGHFFAPLSVNGKTIQGLIDTGATIVALRAEDAAELGIDFSTGEQSTSATANGPMVNRVVTVPSLTVAGVAMDKVQVACCINSSVSLIGMSFLSRVHFSVTGNTLNIYK